jgi:mRNA interferase MazF
VRFPFSDLSNSKLRPAIVLADAKRDDWILCQITSKSYSDAAAIEINSSDFASGSLLKVSYARPGKLFTANNRIMAKETGTLRKQKLDEILESVVLLLRPDVPRKSSK